MIRPGFLSQEMQAILALARSISAFLLPLTAWVLLCVLWVPDVIVIDQGEGVYKPGDRVEFELNPKPNKDGGFTLRNIRRGGGK